MLDKKSGSESLKTGFDMDILKVKILLFFFENTLKFICYVNFRLQPKVIVFCILLLNHERDHWVLQSYLKIFVHYLKIEVTEYIHSLLRIFKIAG